MPKTPPAASVAVLRAHPADSTDDRALVESARRGSNWAKEALFRRHAARVTALLTRLLSSVADAQDATQDTFIEAFRDLEALADAGAFGGWITRIAVHQAHRRFRRRRLLAWLGLDHSDDAALDQLASASASPELVADLHGVARLVRKLPSEERIAWMLRYVEGYRLADIALSCDCSLATAKRRVSAAHQKLARKLGLAEATDDE